MENQHNGRALQVLQTNAISHNDTLEEIRQKLESFNKAIHRAPKGPVKVNQQAGGSKYVPIEELEMLMDEIFMGHWQSKAVGGGAKIVGNSVVYDIEVSFLHPVSGMWITRAGSGAVPIQLKSQNHQGGARHALDFERINPMAIQKNAPAAKAYAFRNAVQSIGRMFGRDLNRDSGRTYNSIYSNKMEENNVQE